MKIHHSMAFVLLFLLLAIFAGCGSDTGQTPIAVTTSQQCVGCHASNSVSISPVTGQRITDEWLRSPHNTINGAGCPNCHTTAHFHQNTVDCLACHSSHDHPDSCGQCHGGSTKITSCRNCHATAHSDPNSCGDCHDASGQVKASLANPDVAGRCLGCHSALGAPHFSTNIISTSHDAQYVDQQNLGNCRNCHNPHDNTVLPAAKAWAQSAHGDVHGVAWSTEDFKANKNCLRCHTATGYVSYVTGTPAFTLPSAPLAASPTYGVLGCNGCHKDYNFTNHTSVRKIPAYIAPYNNGLSPQYFPNVSVSNLCIPCHSGRENNDSIDSVTDFTNASFKNSHYMAAAGLMYMKVGFTRFTSAAAVIGTSTYGKSYSLPLPVSATGTTVKGGVDAAYGGVLGGVQSAHRGLGTPTIRGSEIWMTPSTYGLWEKNGPCVTCHINANIDNMPVFTGDTTKPPFLDTNKFGAISSVRSGNGHTLSISPDTAKQLCIPCHNDAGGFDNPETAVELKLEEARPFFNAALAVIAKLLANAPYNIKFDPTAHPYFYDLTKDPTGKTPVRDWTRGTNNQTFGKKVMGACFNLNLLTRDPAAYVHARTYSQRLLFDTVDFLDDGVMNKSSAATLIANDPVTFPNTNDHWVYKTGGARK